MSETVSGQDLYQWRQWAACLAKENNIDVSEVDWLLQGLTPLKSLSLRLDTYRDQSSISTSASLSDLTKKWNQRVYESVPVQYLAGETPWRHFSLTVTPDVLIPRPETELIVNIAETLVAESDVLANDVSASGMAAQYRRGNWADLGTGSGAIALGLAHTFPAANIYATDISSRALAVAQQNAIKNQLANRIILSQGIWLTPLSALKHQLSGIVTNPPYIPSQTVLTLQPEVAQHEPHLALDGGSDGLDCIRTIINDSPTYLVPGGIWITELMDGQAPGVAELLARHGDYTHITIHPDLSGVSRFVSARKAL